LWRVVVLRVECSLSLEGIIDRNNVGMLRVLSPTTTLE